MNQLTSDHFVITVFILCLIIAFLISVIVLLSYKLFSILTRPSAISITTENSSNPKLTHDHVIENLFCINHLKEKSVGVCLICEDSFCEKCLTDHQGMSFCKEHYAIFTANEWKHITDLKTTPQNPTEGIFIYNFKRAMWKNKKIPSFILTHYKINTDLDHIESYVQLYVKKGLEEQLAHDLTKFQNS